MTTTATDNLNGLPGPTERPQADIVVFDGQCRFCTAQVKQLAWWDGGGRLAYLSLHDPQVSQRWPDLSRDDLMEQMVVIDGEGHKHWGPYAVRYLTRRLPRLWWAMPVLNFPGSMLLWRPLYRLIARNRYRFMGKLDDCEGGTCSLHQH